MTAMTPAAWLHHIRGEHVRVSHPVPHCLRCRQNWPCDVIRAIEAATAAERDRIRDGLPGITTVLFRPGNGPAMGEEHRVVAVEKLTALLDAESRSGGGRG